jgi:hypothetical protein
VLILPQIDSALLRWAIGNQHGPSLAAERKKTIECVGRELNSQGIQTDVPVGPLNVGLI